jgi:hypothetical protein
LGDVIFLSQHSENDVLVGSHAMFAEMSLSTPVKV